SSAIPRAVPRSAAVCNPALARHPAPAPAAATGRGCSPKLLLGQLQPGGHQDSAWETREKVQSSPRCQLAQVWARGDSWDFFVYGGALLLAFSLVFWVFWYTFNIEVFSQPLLCPHTAPPPRAGGARSQPRHWPVPAQPSPAQGWAPSWDLTLPALAEGALGESHQKSSVPAPCPVPTRAQPLSLGASTGEAGLSTGKGNLGAKPFQQAGPRCGWR
uniref:Uncharacterized protein n=1 Tax=Serinus canaria TaxID=9135 RepID=A0A8C9MJY9_SERCA